MGEWFSALTGLEQVFVICAAVGLALFVIRVILQFIVGGDADGGGSDIHTGDVSGGSDVGFTVLSLHSLTIFLAIFGLSGLALLREAEANNAVAVGGAFVAGAAGVLLISALMSFFRGMQSSGNIDINNAVGQEGEVYLRIPAGGSGKVTVTVQNRQTIFDAEADPSTTEIKSGDRVRVIRVAAGSRLIVTKS